MFFVLASAGRHLAAERFGQPTAHGAGADGTGLPTATSHPTGTARNRPARATLRDTESGTIAATGSADCALPRFAGGANPGGRDFSRADSRSGPLGASQPQFEGRCA